MNPEQSYHQPVMLDETQAHLNVKKDCLYIDATLGDGGHSIEILKLGGKVLGIDYDNSAIDRATNRINKMELRINFKAAWGNFTKIDAIAHENGFNQVNGIIMDLGYSTYQLEMSDKGLSFSLDQPLDMRLGPDLGVTAADLVNALNVNELTKLISDYSDEKFAKKFATAIVKHRNLKKIQTTKELADLISSEAPSGYEHGRIHPATRTFQALRLAVNDELNNLSESLPRAARLLLPGSRLIVISFQSKEDQIVKNFGRGAQPVLLRSLYKKPLVPSEEEVTRNSRSRSSRMRVFERV
jgi:16S rRNA (cytosine1402-N4)-methyltransferase